MIPASYNFELYQGDHVLKQLVISTGPELGPWTPIDLTGLTPKSQIRTLTTSAEVLAEFLCTIVGDPANGTVQLYLSPEQTAVLTKGDKVWDFELTTESGQFRDTYLAGRITVKEEVTRP